LGIREGRWHTEPPKSRSQRQTSGARCSRGRQSHSLILKVLTLLPLLPPISPPLICFPLSSDIPKPRHWPQLHILPSERYNYLVWTWSALEMGLEKE
jgi:hypothetical protein